MAFTSITFVGFIIVVVMLCSLMVTAWQRDMIFLGANLFFIASYVDSAIQLLPLACFLASAYAAIEINRRMRSSLALWMSIVLIVSGFVFLKKFGFLSESFQLPFPYLLIGFSYVLFRVLHLTVDARQGELDKQLSVLQFFNYTCNFLTFIAGPIQRYPDFVRQSETHTPLTDHHVFVAVSRIVWGFVKVGVVSAIFKYLFDTASVRLLAADQVLPTVQFSMTFVAAAVLYTVYLYANFSGYMDIVIGVGELMGMRLPENFNKPFLARNFLDFWARWHMSLSDWFKTYLFNPLLTFLARRVTSPTLAPYLGVIAFFATFLVMGIWHGTTSVFVIYGLVMGAGASINKLWQMKATAHFGKKRYRAIAEKPLVIYWSRGLTTAYFALALTCLWVDMAQLAALWGRLGLAGLLFCYLGLACAAGLAFYLTDSAIAISRSLGAGLGWTLDGVIVRNLFMASQILLIFTVSSFFHKAPEFVYRAF